MKSIEEKQDHAAHAQMHNKTEPSQYQEHAQQVRYALCPVAMLIKLDNQVGTYARNLRMVRSSCIHVFVS